jgi:hypothetical protein
MGSFTEKDEKIRTDKMKLLVKVEELRVRRKVKLLE